MNELLASRTALTTALMRARHTRLDPSPLIDDAWGDRLVPESFREALRDRVLQGLNEDEPAGASASPTAVLDDYLRRIPAYANVILRSRYAEDALQDAVANGVRQYVMIGAGFDSFSLRKPAFAQDLVVYEVDHPATQSLKLARLQECGIARPAASHFVAADLGAESLESALSRAPYRRDQPSFSSWLGVTPYLTRQANLATLRAIAACGAPGSELVFTYMDQRLLDPGQQTDSFRKMQQAVAAIGEPFVSGFDPAALAGDLEALGLALVEDLDGEQAVQRYDAAGANGLRSSTYSHLALVRVGY